MIQVDQRILRGSWYKCYRHHKGRNNLSNMFYFGEKQPYMWCEHLKSN